MPHADSSLVPSSITSKTEFWAHVHGQLASLLSGQRHWVTNLANASSMVYSSLLAFTAHFGSGSQAVNWCGFYLNSSLFPVPRFLGQDGSDNNSAAADASRLLLGPFCGKPACQFINISPGKARGVCADAYLQRRTILVPEVDLYPGHIACDGETKSEIVCPLIFKKGDKEIMLGVLDLDCLAVSGFCEEDKEGLEKIAALVVSACDW
ncbi:hypothetical protein SERLADRAFT_348269 [Serpula lacrymans var. lacrymans S7.9]|uniref:GAF domain-containing protein n=1 Tax=Serpula lacrymans var. lacrymans (strain S7.9) TaxID=578457 RepID=F8NUG8_SERL9|nr:uncharacterized protein SERLADRAFT_348269 [Serpula lacrymans var. lacrymans S7.9]EGO25880.1 hypothetical protein SERLADRAFT_348269 [Serpula lacrymans var. lacrymans S7.9]